jgi:hypothetical protein
MHHVVIASIAGFLFFSMLAGYFLYNIPVVKELYDEMLKKREDGEELFWDQMK